MSELIYWSCQRGSTKASRVLAGLQEGRLTHIRPARLLILRAAAECRPAPDIGNTVVTLHSSKGDLYQKAPMQHNTLSPRGAKASREWLKDSIKGSRIRLEKVVSSLSGESLMSMENSK